MSLTPELRARSRIVSDLRRHGLGSVPMLGRYNLTHARPGLRDHRHRGAIEICYLARGRQIYHVGGSRYSLRGGDLFITFPDEVHGTGGEPEEKGLLYWMTLLDPAGRDGGLMGLTRHQSRALWKNLTGSSLRHFPGTPDMQGQLDRVIRAIHSAPTPLSRTRIANDLIAFLLAVVDAREASARGNERRRFGKVLDHLQAHLDEPEEQTVARMAELTGLSVSRFKAAFKQEMGIPPAEYALRCRIEEAARRLARHGATVTGVAFDLGFSSSQYFASAFKRFTNANPSELLGGKAEGCRLKA